jgi:type IV secretion system protein VirB6
MSCSDLVGAGVIRGVLGAVDCQTRAFAEAGYSSLTSASSTFQVALTALLTIYVAVLGFRMLFARGGARLTDAPGIALMIGAVLALVTSWSTFQTLVFDVAAKAPSEIAGLVAAPVQAAGGSLAADPVGGLQTAYDQLTQAATAFGKMAGPNVRSYSSPAAAAAETLSAATGVLFMTTAGIMAAATLAIGVLTAAGPIFIALVILPATRGLFAGWLRALAAAALVPLLGWLAIVLMLSVLEPWLVRLAQERALAQLDPQTAMSAAALVFVFGAAQVALTIAAGVVAFGLKLPRAEAAEPALPPALAEREIVAATRAERLAFELQRDEARAFARERTLQIAAASAAGPAAAAGREPIPAERPARLGDAYRRPAVTGRRPEAHA